MREWGGKEEELGEAHGRTAVIDCAAFEHSGAASRVRGGAGTEPARQNRLQMAPVEFCVGHKLRCHRGLELEELPILDRQGTVLLEAASAESTLVGDQPRLVRARVDQPALNGIVEEIDNTVPRLGQWCRE